MTFVKQMSGAAALGVAMLVGFGLSALPAQAGYVVTLEQVGLNVVATGSGPIDLTGLSKFSTNSGLFPQESPVVGYILTGPAPLTGPADLYNGFTGPSSFGSGPETFASSGGGDAVGIFGTAGGFVAVPAGYMSGGALSDTATYDNETFASLGVTPGTYEWMWGTGTNQNFTLDIVTAAVPAPVIGQGLPVVLAVGVVLLGAKLSERNRKRRSLGTQTA